jgi:hypothetical protein
MDGTQKAIAAVAVGKLLSQEWNCLRVGPDPKKYTPGEWLQEEHLNGCISKSSYLGHNIVALAFYCQSTELPVPVAYGFNHVTLFQSHLHTHAEQRLLDWCFKNPHHYHHPPGHVKYSDQELGKLLTVVSSLEPCWSCAGSLKMAGVREVVYIQRDPGVENSLGKVAAGLLNGAPGPIDTCAGSIMNKIGHYDIALHLDAEYSKFCANPPPIFKEKKAEGIPAFLCTSKAKEVWQTWSNKWETLPDGLPLEHQQFWKSLDDYLKEIKPYNRGTIYV